MSGISIPKISVVMTCYNCGRYVEDAIRSVALQTLRSFECVIVDDASTDDSAEVIRRTLDELNDPRFMVVRLAANAGQTGASREGLKRTNAPFVCFLDSDDVWNECFLARHLAAHMNDAYAVGFTACNARIIDGQGALIAGAIYWFGQLRSEADRDLQFIALDSARVPAIDSDKGVLWQHRSSYALYTKRSLEWVWVSTSSMMFRRSLIDMVFPDDDDFRLNMDFYLVLMAQMMTGCLLLDDSLYSYRLHGQNSWASNPILGGRLNLSARDLTSTYGKMCDRMLEAMIRDCDRFTAALGADQYIMMVKAMRAAHTPTNMLAAPVPTNMLAAPTPTNMLAAPAPTNMLAAHTPTAMRAAHTPTNWRTFWAKLGFLLTGK